MTTEIAALPVINPMAEEAYFGARPTAAKVVLPATTSS